MTQPNVISGTYADLKFIKTRSVAQVVVEIPIEAADAFLKLFGAPQPGQEVPVAIARLMKNAPADSKERKPFESLPLPQQVALRCNDARFQVFLEEKNAEDAAAHIRLACGVVSRALIIPRSKAAPLWFEIEDRFQAYLTDQQYAGQIR
jgi:hypothetical protein